MKVLSCTFIVLATLALSTCSSSSSTRQVLKFGSTVQDYVMFRPNMGYFTSQFSLCSWVKKLRTGANPNWFNYVTATSVAEISLIDFGWSKMFSSPTLNKLVNQLGITPGTWYHYCMCWSYSSRTADIYYDGRKVGPITTRPGRRLYTDGVLVLGQQQWPYGRIHNFNYYTFGGELFKLNMFSKKFTAADVRAMYQAGICSEEEKVHGSYRQLTWESILQQTRRGNVQLVDLSVSCVLDNKLAVTQRELEEVEGRLDDKETELQEIKSGLTETQSGLETTQSELQEIKSDLTETQSGLETTLSELQGMRSDLTETQSKLETTQSELVTINAELRQKLNRKYKKTTQSELQGIRSDLTETQAGLETAQSELVTINAELTQKLNQTQSKLETTQYELETTKSELETTQSELQGMRSDLTETQSNLETTQSELEEVEGRLENKETQLQEINSDLTETQSGLETTQSELETTQSELETTQSELETTQSELETTQSELETTQSELETTQSELETLKADLNKRLNLSQSELATKVELELTKTLLAEFQIELKSIKANLGQRLDQIQNETEETKTKFQCSLTALEESKSKLEETQNELKETKTELALYSRNSTRSVLPVLKFGTAVGDYIMFSPNMEPFTDQFSLCSWVRKTDGQPYWISYATEESNSEIGINVQGLSNIFHDNFDWRRHLDVTPGTWYHYCMCWNVSSRMADIYLNGVKAGSITTPLGRRLDTGGSLVLGKYQSEDGEILTKHDNHHTFGGELLKLNIFSKKFSEEEVRAMFQAGMCSDIEETYESFRRLTWESIIEQPRRGNVELVDSVISCTSAGSGEETVSEMTGEEITTHN